MNLVKALRIDSSSKVAFVGAGGKSSTMFELARQLPPPVLVTATTHLGVWQLDLADRHFQVEVSQDVELLGKQDLFGITLITGNRVEPERVAGVSFDCVKKIFALADDLHIPVLIEADGSRQLPLKAPSTHEPPIPLDVNTVIVVAGLSSLGNPLNSSWVHRPDRFSILSGLPQGKKITIDAVAKVLKSVDGGLKNIPSKARRLVLLNQADTVERGSLAQSLSRLLIPPYDSVVIGSVQQNFQKKVDANAYQNQQSQVFAVYEPTAGIVLAAGGSSRLGKPKQLLSWKGKTFVQAVTGIALKTGLSPVVVVTGAYADMVEKEIKDMPVTVVHNPEWETGQSSSVKVGLQALPRNVGGVVFLLSDQPQIRLTLIRKLIEAHAQTLSPIVAPLIDGLRGNPVIFDRDTFSDFSELEGDVGGRRLFSRYTVEWVEWHDRQMLLDVDTPEDYQHLLNMDQ
jgi:molybdenum cofactor cytidylyltransferase